MGSNDLRSLYTLGRLPRSSAFDDGGGGDDGFCRISIILAIASYT
ncbi:hypothetical protein [[Scytonema hofmanni] UTEX B 1581]|nr:hypothetical protein [[Scytonema hofmanni] UTEX B 1581]